MKLPNCRIFHRTRLHRAVMTAALSGALGISSANAETYRDVDTITISDFTGRLTVSIGGDAVEAEIIDGPTAFEISVVQKKGHLIVDGPDRPRGYDVHRHIKRRLHGDKAFEKFLDDYPVMHLTVPSGSDLNLDDAIAIASVGDLQGAFMLKDGYIEAVVGDVASADISVVSAGALSVGHVGGPLIGAVKGSGDFSALSAYSAELSVSGSGDMTIGPVKEDVALSVKGSGDVLLGDIGGALEASIGGSGDVEAGHIGAGAQFSISGSGDIEVRSVNGETKARITGSGGVDIDGGRADNLDVSIAGSGDFAFGGVSSNLNATVSGAGQISVAKNEGDLNTSRQGDIRVAGRKVNRD